MTKKAVAYVSDVILGRTGEVISREYQRDLIKKHAEENGIEIVAWFEDEMYNEDVMTRPGIQALFACDKPYDTILVERVWSLSRQMKVLEPFMKEIEMRGHKLESATTMWDCVSQMCRRRFSPPLPKAFAGKVVVRREETEPAKVKKPERINFLNLATSPQRS